MFKSLSYILIATLIIACTAKRTTTVTRDDGPGATLKVMTYNIHHANPPSEKVKIDLDAIAAVINAEKPDLVGLQEVDRLTKRSGNIDEAKLLAEKTGMHYGFFKAIDYDGGEYGLAILSRFPIAKSGKVDLPQAFKAEHRILSFVEVTLPGEKGSLLFTNTHMDSERNDGNRIVQMKRILTELGPKTGAMLLCGDLNCESKAEPIVLLDEKFKRSCIADCQPTIPQYHPVKTIDYIASRNVNWSVAEHRVIAETYASDHRPVVVVYKVK